MAIFKVYKNNNYTVMSNYHFKDRNLSLKAKGLLSLMLSLPENWDYSIGGLVSICKENETAIKNALAELKEFGYVEIIKLTPKQTESGRFEYVYNIYETPKQDGKKQGVENLPLENLPLENPPLYKNTNNKNTNNKEKSKKEKNDSNKKIKKEKEKSLNQLIESYTENIDLQNALFEFIKMRNMKKRPMTNFAFERMIKKLDNIAGNNDELKIEVIGTAIEHCWDTVYSTNYITQYHNKKTSYDIDEYEKTTSNMTKEELEMYYLGKSEKEYWEQDLNMPYEENNNA